MVVVLGAGIVKGGLNPTGAERKRREHLFDPNVRRSR
jgi:hypothetical protein